MDLKEQIKVMQHYADGGEIESRPKIGDYLWRVAEEPFWDWSRCDYRISRTPKNMVLESMEERLNRERKAVSMDVKANEWWCNGFIAAINLVKHLDF